MVSGFRSKLFDIKDHAFSHHTVLTPDPKLKALFHLHTLCSHPTLCSLDHFFWALLAQALRLLPAWFLLCCHFHSPVLQPSMFTPCLKIRHQIVFFLGSSQPILGFPNLSRLIIFSTAIPLKPERGLRSGENPLQHGHKPHGGQPGASWAGPIRCQPGLPCRIRG